jgi:L-rhamnose isomerase/sugar isomerase
VEDLGALRAHIGNLGLRVGAVNPNLFQDPDYKLGSLTNPDGRVRQKALDHLLGCAEIATELGATAQSLWLADGTNYAGQDDLRARRARLQAGLTELYAALPSEQELLVEYKLFEPAFYATDLADWGSALLLCQRLGERARVLVDLGHHAQGVNVEQIVAILAQEQRLGGFHFNNRKYADDDLIVGSVNPFELFLIFAELVHGGDPLPRLTIDQSHNVEAKVEAMVLSVVNLQEAYAKALLVDRSALSAAQIEGDVLAGHEALLDAYSTDVRPVCAKVRVQLGAAADPVAELRASGYADRVAGSRS